jgi:hypothetical protein
MLDEWVALNSRDPGLEALVDEERLSKTLANIPCFQPQVVATYPNKEPTFKHVSST